MKARTVFCTAAAVLCMSAAGSVTVFDFEDGTGPAIKAKTYSVGITNAYATSGEHGLRFRCDTWKPGMPEWPSFTVTPPVSDWSKYDAMSIDVVSLADAGDDHISIFIAGPEGRIQGGLHASVKLPPRGHVQWIVPLADKWPKTAPPENITRFHMFTSNPRAVDVVVDRITLLEKGEKPPVPDGPCVGRDILPLMTASREAMLAANDLLRRRVDRQRDFCRFLAASSNSRYSSPEMALGTATSMEKIRPRSRFSVSAIPDDGLKVRLARNERESLQLLVAPVFADLTNVRVRVGHLKGPGGAVFAASNVTCGVTGYVNALKRPPYKIGFTEPSDKEPGYLRKAVKPDTGWWPDPILDFMKSADIRGEDVQSFWVRVHCPGNQKAGTYTGQLGVAAEGVQPVMIPFTVRVNDFSVPQASPLPMAITFNPGPSGQFATPEEQIVNARLRKDPLAPVNMWKKREAEWGDFLADYYITMDSLYHRGGSIRFDVLERLRAQGRLGVFNLGYWSYPKSTNDADIVQWREATVPRLRKAYDEAKARGLLQSAYCYGCDEVPADHFDAMRMAVAELRAALPGVPISTTAYDHEFGVGTPLEVMDWFTPLTPKFDPDKAAKSREKGHQVWWYICCGPGAPHANMFIECPAIDGRILMGAQTVRMRPDGFLYYQISLWNSSRCIESGPFTDWTARSWTTYHGDGSWTCCGPDGSPLPTVRLENFRDGLEDYAYALELERRLAARKGRDDAWSRRAKELLAVPRDVMEDMKNFTADPAAVYRWRDAMADLIESAGR